MLGALPVQAPSIVSVPWLTVEASAGPGAVAAVERRRRDVLLERSLLRGAGVGAGSASIIDARGDSMAPNILDGDRLLVDLADTEMAEASGIFVLRLGDDLLVKRLTMAGRCLVVASDNPAYPVRRVAACDADVRGRVKLLIRRPR